MNLLLRAAAAAALLSLPATAQSDIIAIRWTGQTYALDSASGGGTLVNASGFTSLNSMCAYGGAYYTANTAGSLITIDPVTGLGTAGATLSPVINVRGLATDPTTGIMYAIADGSPDTLRRVDPVTGAVSLVGSTNFPGLQGFAIDQNGRGWAWDVGSGNPVTGQGLVTIDLATGAGTDVNPSYGQTAPNYIQALAFSPSGQLYGAQNVLLRIDQTTGIDTVVGSGSYTDIRGFEFTGSASATTYGNGCAGGFGIPSATPANSPTLGTTFMINVANLDPSAAFAFMAIGFSNTNSILGPLPFALQPFGLGANCNLWTSADASVLFGVSGGSGTFSIGIPASPVWAGFNEYFQAASIDGAAPGGIAVSNGVAATFG